MRTYLEGLAVFGVSGLAIVFFAVCWAVTDLDALTILNKYSRTGSDA